MYVDFFPKTGGHFDFFLTYFSLQLDEPHDIATSIKKLARSVHGDVFGDLPRPRFSTQI